MEVAPDRIVPGDVGAAALLGGEMGERIIHFDWSAHPLGAMPAWPAWMRVTVSEMLASRFPTVLWFGDELFLMYNDAYLSILGDKHPAALGAPGREVWSEIWDVIGPMLGGVMENGVATWSADLRLRLNRRGLAEDGYFTFTYSPMFEDSGGVGGIFCAVHETTGTVLGARRLETLSTLGAAVVEHADAAAVVHAAVAVCDSNRADLPFVAFYLADGEELRLAGCTAGLAEVLEPLGRQARGWSVDALGGPDSPDGALLLDDLGALAPGIPELLAASPARQALAIPMIGGPAQDQVGWMLAGISPVLILDRGYRSFCEQVAGHVARAVRAARLLELERERLDALVELDRAKTEFFANVSHEFRTPLTLIAAPIDDVLAEAEDLPAAQRERLQMARANTARMSKLVNNLLDFATLEAGAADPDWQRLDLAAITTDLISMFRSAFQAAGVGLVTDIVSPLPAVVDGAMWERIVLNLLSNALKYTLKGTVRVGLHREGQLVRLTVADSGIGIPPDQQELIFTRFHRASDAGRSIEGTGIGLAMARQLVNVLGGEITVESAPGEGSEFTVTVPAAGGRVAKATVRAAGEVAGSGTTSGIREHGLSDAGRLFVDEAMQWLSDPDGPGEPVTDRAEDRAGRRRVLIVDDNLDLRGYLERVIAPLWDTESCAGVEGALEAISRARPDLILSDVMMPNVDGFGLLSRLRADPDLRDIPVILISARAGASAAIEGIERGAADYIVKPFSSREVIRRVAARLRESDERSELDRSRARAREALVQLSGALATAGTPGGVATAVLEAIEQIAPALMVALATTQPDEQVLQLEFAGQVSKSIRGRWRQVGLETESPLTQVARTQLPFLSSDAHDLAEIFPSLRSDDVVEGLRGFAVLPLSVDKRVQGALALGWRVPVELDTEQIAAIEEMAELVARTCERMRILGLERALTAKLQEELLGLPIRCGQAAISARYSSSIALPGVGGDWYDAFEVGPDRIGIAVGDIVGHGIESAAVMSQLRSVLAAAAMQDSDPAEAIASLDRFAARIPGAVMATAAYAVIDIAGETVRYCCAGHPPPVFVSTTGDVDYLSEGRGAPLATSQTPPTRPVGEHPFPAGSLLLLYTDGLIERRGRSLDTGLDRLRQAVADRWNLSVRELTSGLMQAAQDDGDPDDDMAVIAIRSAGTDQLLHLQALRADPRLLSGMREQLRDWLAAMRLPHDQCEEIVLAVNEAATNALEHGSDMDARKVVTLEGAVRGSELLLCVSDSGHWRPNNPGNASMRGYGHRLMEALMDGLETNSDRYGTTVTLTRRMDAIGA